MNDSLQTDGPRRDRPPEPTVPVVSLDAADAPARIGAALREIGFFSLTDHGVDDALIGRAYDAATAFFARPEEEKRRFEVPGALGQRGYTATGGERAAGAAAADLKEFFQIGPLEEHAPGGPNVWPDEEFRAAIEPLYAALRDAAVQVAAAVSEHLGLGREFLPDRIVGGESILRLIHYPPVPADAPPAATRAAAHADINLLTLLVGATAAGLEIQTRDGAGWLPVVAQPGQIVADSGDMLQNLTGGVIRSTVHRVVNPPGEGARQARLSMPFFCHPRPDVDLTPLDLPGAEPQRFRTLTAGEFLTERLKAIRPGG
ncbi:isopenicillin N synthase family dioxygenase [Alienimonas californiensis]|uniref:2-oxoglutarate-dependent ethylene/succinate-forming enzyme n=1 Tax=Alienimonas californiensis TaxID=2527989 RepID=A0A517PD29_9PLAN|nr:2-oxoglutarate and iron-dependent oxygenase domain-containing protein [Alienimonas californiensis]QDT17279.1 Deacetoxycephalosporin C synthase [Alienimonas californiensis]